MNISHILRARMRQLARVIAIAISLALILPESAVATGPAHGFSPVHPLKYKSGFTHFDYVNLNAPKGGTLRLGAIGTFDTLNTLRYPGRSPASRSERFNIRNLIFDTLLVKSADEPAGYYGLLAKSVEVASDHSWARFSLRSDARWHDGEPITANDIKFTFETLVKQGPPYVRQVLRGVKVSVEDKATVLIKAPHPGDRDFTGRVGMIAIHPKHFWTKHDVAKGGMTKPLGSGPYQISSIDNGKKISFERNAKYWAADHPANAGRYNFEHIQVEFYRDSTVALEAFKAGAFDLRVEQDAVRWATGYAGPSLSDGRIKMNAYTGSAPGQLMTLVFNLRRDMFKDIRVRRAINLAYDFAWTNTNLFHGQYEPVTSFFAKTRNAASGAAGDDERKLLSPYASKLPTGILDAASPTDGKPARDRRAALSEAKRLLDEAGFRVHDGVRIDPATKKPMSIKLVYLNPRLSRVLGAFANSLKRLGITLKYPSLEPVTASKTILGHEYDMAALDRWNPGLVPGTSESLVWGSALADRTPSYALSGARDEALDATIKAMSSARSLEALQTGARAFDRLLRWKQYTVPMWRSSKLWVAHWKSIALPSYNGLDLLTLTDLAWRADKTATPAGQ